MEHTTGISELDNCERADFIERYTKPEDYYTDSCCPTLHIPKEGKPTLDKEIRLARRIACFGCDVYLLPEKLKDRYGSVYASFKPDSIAEGIFLELKEMSNEEHKNNIKAIQNIFRKAKKQGDAAYLHIPFAYPKEKVTEAINRQLNGLNDIQQYIGKGLIVSTASDDNLTFYMVKKNGTLTEGIPFGSPTLADFNRIRTDSIVT